MKTLNISCLRSREIVFSEFAWTSKIKMVEIKFV